MEESNVVFIFEDDFGIIIVLDRVFGCVCCLVIYDVFCDGFVFWGFGRGVLM